MKRLFVLVAVAASMLVASSVFALQQDVVASPVVPAPVRFDVYDVNENISAHGYAEYRGDAAVIDGVETSRLNEVRVKLSKGVYELNVEDSSTGNHGVKGFNVVRDIETYYYILDADGLHDVQRPVPQDADVIALVVDSREALVAVNSAKVPQYLPNDVRAIPNSNCSTCNQCGMPVAPGSQCGCGGCGCGYYGTQNGIMGSEGMIAMGIVGAISAAVIVHSVTRNNGTYVDPGYDTRIKELEAKLDALIELLKEILPVSELQGSI
ncbi:MAG: hypothetical protein HUK22_02445 [Thermoguttaceae bacterium]|nr:hypothetical protein [Thermoguttaceae bacterium]